MPDKQSAKSRIKNGAETDHETAPVPEESGTAHEKEESPPKSPKTQRNKTGQAPTAAQVKAANLIEELEARQKEVEDKYIRLRAEFDNHIKRTNKEKSELLEYTGSHIIRSILPILDDLQRTVEHARQDQQPQDEGPVVEGVKMIIEKFQKVLENAGVEVIQAVGEEFDPEFHEALMTRNSDEYPEGIVVEEYEPGYIYKGRVLRHAKVIVSG